MSKPNLILIGAGGHAHACIDVIEQHGRYQIAGLIGKPAEMHALHFGYSVIATDSDLPALASANPYALITLGQIKSPEMRIHLFHQAISLGYQFPAIVAPSAHVSRHATVGAGTIVMHGAIVNAGAKIGSNCIINTRALIEHDVTVDDHCHISTGAILNGDVVVGAGSFVGSGSVIREGVSIGNSCIVGIGLCLRHDQTDYARFVGNDRS